MSEPLNVTVERSKWYRGRTSGDSRLLIHSKYVREEDNGKMCCLGFACLAAGLTTKAIIDMGFPHVLLNEHRVTEIPDSLKPLVNGSGRAGDYNAISQVCEQIGTTNDVPGLTEKERETKLIELGAQAGIRFTFVD